MEAVNGVLDGGPPPPSPLTGCYLLIVVGEPHSQEHKDIILQRVAKGLLSWDVNDCLIDLEKELAIINEQAPEGEEARYGERLIQYASENLVTEVLIHPAVSTLAQCIRNLLSSFTRHRHIIHAGYTFAANGSWILQDGTFSFTDFAEAFQELDVQRVVRAYENSISIDIHCSSEGDWTRLPKEPYAKNCKVRVNPVDVLNSGSPSITTFLNYVAPFLVPIDLDSLLECSDVVGNIRFSHPTLYVFPGGQGDAALFGINGFNMLLDGGFSRKACFWDFVRHLDRLDAILLTRLTNGNASGLSAVLKRKMQNALYPQIGHFFCNIQERKAILSPDGDKDKDPLLINLLDEGQEIITNLRKLNLSPQMCYRDTEPINLYHKVGHGTLDMYVLSPAKESKEVKEFLQKWNTNDQKLFSNQKYSKDFAFPLQNLVSICALLVWQPANPNDNITRILYPGSTPQQKIFEGLDRLKNLEYIKHPVCSESKLVTSTSIMALKSKQLKDSSLEKIIQSDQKAQKLAAIESKIKDKPPKSGEIKATKVENKLIESDKSELINGIAVDTDSTDKSVKKSDSTDSEKSTKSTKVKKADDKDDKAKPKPEPKLRTDLKPKSKVDTRPKRPIGEKKASPTTPKKTIESKMNGDAKDVKTRVSKVSPSATPAKSTKEANNRKVIESKYKTAPKKEPVKAADKKEAKPERKPISRRPKGTSPTTKTAASPVKKLNGVQKPDTILKKAKLDKEGTTDSSTVSTPSADQKDLSKLTSEELEQLKAQELADLKEEQEVVKEIEAVFRKGENQEDNDSELRKIKDVSIDDKTEPEEYLIIEKEEIEHDSLDDRDTKEDETQKHARDSEESEKLRKSSDANKIVEVPVEIPEIPDEKKEKSSEESPKDKEIKSKDDKEKPETSKEISVVSPDDKIDVSSERKMAEDNQELNVALESQPDERFSATVESGATTAPTLPEDERITLDEIKEDNGDQAIEEKHVKEDTKEKEVPLIQLPPKTFEPVCKLPPVVGIRLDKQSHIRDIVKTPDEVADLPVHEEADIENYQMDLKPEDTRAEPKAEDKTSPVKDDAEKLDDEKETQIEAERAEKIPETDEKERITEKMDKEKEIEKPAEAGATGAQASEPEIKDISDKDKETSLETKLKEASEETVDKPQIDSNIISEDAKISIQPTETKIDEKDDVKDQPEETEAKDLTEVKTIDDSKQLISEDESRDTDKVVEEKDKYEKSEKETVLEAKLEIAQKEETKPVTEKEEEKTVPVEETKLEAKLETALKEEIKPVTEKEEEKAVPVEETKLEAKLETALKEEIKLVTKKEEEKAVPVEETKLEAKLETKKEETKPVAEKEDDAKLEQTIETAQKEEIKPITEEEAEKAPPAEETKPEAKLEIAQKEEPKPVAEKEEEETVPIEETKPETELKSAQTEESKPILEKDEEKIPSEGEKVDEAVKIEEAKIDDKTTDAQSVKIEAEKADEVTEDKKLEPLEKETIEVSQEIKETDEKDVKLEETKIGEKIQIEKDEAAEEVDKKSQKTDEADKEIKLDDKLTDVGEIAEEKLVEKADKVEPTADEPITEIKEPSPVESKEKLEDVEIIDTKEISKQIEGDKKDIQEKPELQEIEKAEADDKIKIAHEEQQDKKSEKKIEEQTKEAAVEEKVSAELEKVKEKPETKLEEPPIVLSDIKSISDEEKIAEKISETKPADKETGTVDAEKQIEVVEKPQPDAKDSAELGKTLAAPIEKTDDKLQEKEIEVQVEKGDAIVEPKAKEVDSVSKKTEGVKPEIDEPSTKIVDEIDIKDSEKIESLEMEKLPEKVELDTKDALEPKIELEAKEDAKLEKVTDAEIIPAVKKEDKAEPAKEEPVSDAKPTPKQEDKLSDAEKPSDEVHVEKGEQKSEQLKIEDSGKIEPDTTIAAVDEKSKGETEQIEKGEVIAEKDEIQVKPKDVEISDVETPSKQVDAKPDIEQEIDDKLDAKDSSQVDLETKDDATKSAEKEEIEKPVDEASMKQKDEVKSAQPELTDAHVKDSTIELEAKDGDSLPQKVELDAKDEIVAKIEADHEVSVTKDEDLKPKSEDKVSEKLDAKGSSDLEAKIDKVDAAAESTEKQDVAVKEDKKAEEISESKPKDEVEIPTAKQGEEISESKTKDEDVAIPPAEKLDAKPDVGKPGQEIVDKSDAKDTIDTTVKAEVAAVLAQGAEDVKEKAKDEITAIVDTEKQQEKEEIKAETDKPDKDVDGKLKDSSQTDDDKLVVKVEADKHIAEEEKHDADIKLAEKDQITKEDDTSESIPKGKEQQQEAERAAPEVEHKIDEKDDKVATKLDEKPTEADAAEPVQKGDKISETKVSDKVEKADKVEDKAIEETVKSSETAPATKEEAIKDAQIEDEKIEAIQTKAAEKQVQIEEKSDLTETKPAEKQDAVEDGKDGKHETKSPEQDDKVKEIEDEIIAKDAAVIETKPPVDQIKEGPVERKVDVAEDKVKEVQMEDKPIETKVIGIAPAGEEDKIEIKTETTTEKEDKVKDDQLKEETIPMKADVSPRLSPQKEVEMKDAQAQEEPTDSQREQVPVKIDTKPEIKGEVSIEISKIIDPSTQKEIDERKDEDRDQGEKDLDQEIEAITQDIENAKEKAKDDLKRLSHDEITLKSGSQTESPESSSEQTVQTFKETDIIDKVEVCRKSPKEREGDVAIIVASVAEVLKSDAPLEEFEGKIPLTISPLPPFTASYTTELRETHITTVDSPISDAPSDFGAKTEPIITETIPEKEEPEPEASKRSDLIRDSNELIQATSKIISDIKSAQTDDGAKPETTVHRMLVTASSEDGGEETEICPTGTITFAKSAESSGRSSPESVGRKRTESIVEPQESKHSSGKSTPDIKITSDEQLDQKSEDIKSDRSTPDKGEPQSEKSPQTNGFVDVKDDLAEPDLKDKADSKPRDIQPGESVQLEPEKTHSGKSTPELKEDSGKTSPDVKHGLNGAVSLSGKSSPKLEEKDKSPEGEATVSAEETSDIKRESSASPEQKSASPDMKPQSRTASPQPKPEVKDALDASQPKTISSGKSTPDMKEQIASGKSSPDVHEKITDGVADPTKSAKAPEAIQDQSKIIQEKSDIIKEPSKDSDVKSEPSVDVSDKIPEKSASPVPDVKDLVEKLPAVPTHEIKETEAAGSIEQEATVTSKDEHDVPKLGDDDAAHKEAVEKVAEKPAEIQDVTDLKSTIDDKISTKTLEEEIKESLEKSAQLSGKTTPDVSDRSTPDSKLDTKSLEVKDTTPDVTSGKSSPDLQSVMSGKSTPDAKDSMKTDVSPTETILSGKSTPDMKQLEKLPAEGKGKEDDLSVDSLDQSSTDVSESTQKSPVKVADVKQEDEKEIKDKTHEESKIEKTSVTVVETASKIAGGAIAVVESKVEPISIDDTITKSTESEVEKPSIDETKTKATESVITDVESKVEKTAIDEPKIESAEAPTTDAEPKVEETSIDEAKTKSTEAATIDLKSKIETTSLDEIKSKSAEGDVLESKVDETSIADTKPKSTDGVESTIEKTSTDEPKAKSAEGATVDVESKVAKTSIDDPKALITEDAESKVDATSIDETKAKTAEAEKISIDETKIKSTESAIKVVESIIEKASMAIDEMKTIEGATKDVESKIEKTSITVDETKTKTTEGGTTVIESTIEKTSITVDETKAADVESKIEEKSIMIDVTKTTEGSTTDVESRIETTSITVEETKTTESSTGGVDSKVERTSITVDETTTKSTEAATTDVGSKIEEKTVTVDISKTAGGTIVGTASTIEKTSTIADETKTTQVSTTGVESKVEKTSVTVDESKTKSTEESHAPVESKIVEEQATTEATGVESAPTVEKSLAITEGDVTKPVTQEVGEDAQKQDGKPDAQVGKDREVVAKEQIPADVDGVEETKIASKSPEIDTETSKSDKQVEDEIPPSYASCKDFIDSKEDLKPEAMTKDDEPEKMKSLKDQEDNILVKDDKVAKDKDSGEVIKESIAQSGPAESKDEDSGEVTKRDSTKPETAIEVVTTETTKTQISEKDTAKDLKTDTSGTDKTASEIISSKDKAIDVDKLSVSIKDEACVVGECVLETCERCVTPLRDISDADKKVEESVAGPSKSDALSPPKGDDGDLSGKSTPDIADVEKEKEIQETLKYEKHIPGCSTPPTVPASPIVKEAFHDESLKLSEIKMEKKATEVAAIAAIKEQDVRSSTPGSDDNEYGVTSTQSDISLGQMSRAPNLLESEHHESDEDLGSPLSVTSQIAHSPNYDFEERPPKSDPMNASFYGALPGDEDSGFKSGRFLDDSDLDFEKAMQEHRQTRGEDLEGGPSTHLYEVTTAKFAKIGEAKDEPNLMTSSFIGTELPGQSKEKAKDPIESWGKPLGLPSPAPPSDNKGTPKKERKLPPNVTAKNKLNDDRKRSESPSKKQKKLTPVYVDLTYVPHHGNSNYSYVDFFKRVRARYYVFSGIEPSKEVYNALLEAKQTWEDKDLEVTIIPTYDTDVLGYWVAENEDLLTKCKIDLSPSASRCTINLQDHETSCSAYRLEF